MGLRNIEFWEKLLKDAPDSYKRWFKEERIYLQRHIAKDSEVLEVGCGDGRSLKDLLPITKNITGIDHDVLAVKHAKENFKEYSNVKILLADAKELPFSKESFDIVICMGSFCNFGDYKLKALSEMKRVLKNEGSMIISVFSEGAFEERMKAYEAFKCPIKAIRGTTVVFAEELKDNISEQFSREELIELFDNAGLRPVDIKKVGIGYLCKLVKA